MLRIEDWLLPARIRQIAAVGQDRFDAFDEALLTFTWKSLFLIHQNDFNPFDRIAETLRSGCFTVSGPIEPPETARLHSVIKIVLSRQSTLQLELNGFDRFTCTSHSGCLAIFGIARPTAVLTISPI